MNSWIDEKSITTLRVLGCEIITKAKSGHPGIVLGATAIFHTLFTRHLNIDCNDVQWINRDRFILSAGHASALLYTLLHFSGYPITMDDLKSFRQKDSLTPGHPEYGHTTGVEISAGPLGQGVATSVGIALAEKHLEAKFNKVDASIIDHFTYVICGDGDLQEGVAMEAMSLAGHLKLNKLIVLYDSNDVQLDGDVSLAASDLMEEKVRSMHWNYLLVENGNDCDEIDEAIRKAKMSSDAPTLIEIKTTIGYGSLYSGESSIHGKPLSEGELQQLKKGLNYVEGPFCVDPKVYAFYKKSVTERGAEANSNWNYLLSTYARKYPLEYKEFIHYMFHDFKIENFENLPTYAVGDSVSTRVVMGKVLDWASSQMPNLLGGSADLTPSTMVKGADGIFSFVNPLGRNIKFGVREHAMSAIVNGITLHSGLKGFGAGFFVFSDYAKPAIRMAAIMRIPSIFLFSHDSVCVGEDGPTHQPIEQLTMLRAMPQIKVYRPADAKEMTAAMLLAVENKQDPFVIVSTRQNVPVLAQTDAEGVAKGAYIAYEPKKQPTSMLITCGSELSLCIEVAKKLESENEFVRVVSMPCMEVFQMQDEEYRKQILPPNLTKRMAVEMGASMPWYRFASYVHGIDTFGKSMPLKEIPQEYGFTIEQLYEEFKTKVLNK